MKRNILYTLCGLFLLAGCQQEEMISTEGYLSLTGIEVKAQEVTEVASRAVDESLVVDLYQGETKLRTFTPEEMQNKITLSAATDYSLKVYSTNYGQDASWTNDQKGEPIYYKEQAFEVKEGETTPLKVLVPMSNYAVQLSLPELTWVSSYTFTVTSGTRMVSLQNGEKAYFPYVEGSAFTYQLTLINTDAEEFTLSGTWGNGETESLTFNTCYVVTYQVGTGVLAVSELP